VLQLSAKLTKPLRYFSLGRFAAQPLKFSIEVGNAVSRGAGLSKSRLIQRKWLLSTFDFYIEVNNRPA
jgi:hypothetical protein